MIRDLKTMIRDFDPVEYQKEFRLVSADLITIEEAASLLKVRVRTIYRWQKKGRMPERRRRSRRLMYRRSELLVLLGRLGGEEDE